MMNSDENLLKHCVTHMLKQLEAAEVSDDPFPHFVVRDLFPSDVYAQMMELLPDTSNYQLMDKYNNGAAETRFRMSLEEAHLTTLPAAECTLWRAVRDAIGDPAIKRTVFRKLSSGITFRFGISSSQVDEAPGYPLPELYRELSGYSIAPHPDTRRKVVTMQIALPADNSQAELGTEFYKRSLNPTTLLRFPRGFETIKRMPFLPNSGYAFVVLNKISKKSWHGRDELPSGQGTRNSLLNLYYEDMADASPSLIGKYRSPSRRAA